MCDTGALRKPSVYGRRNLGRRFRTRSTLERVRDSEVEVEVRRRGGARRRWDRKDGGRWGWKKDEEGRGFLRSCRSDIS